MNECPYCLENVVKSEEGVACGSCGAVYHSECWLESGGCCAKGCESAKARIELDVPGDDAERISISSEAARKAVPHKAERNWNPCLRCGRHLPRGELYCRDCAPERESSQDSKNAGPLLLMLALLAVVLGAILLLARMSDEKPAESTKSGIDTILKK